MPTTIDTARVLIQPDLTGFESTTAAGIDRGLAGAETSVDAVIETMEQQFAELAAQITEDFAAIRSSAEDAFADIAGEVEIIGADIEAEFAEVAANIEADFEIMEKSANANFDQMAVHGEETSSRLSGAFGLLSSAGLGVTTAIAGGLGALTVMGLKSAASLEQVNVALDSLTGSVAAGNAQFAELKQFAAATPFEFNDLTTSAERFDAFGASIGLAQSQLDPFLTTIGDLVSETGGGATSLNSITLALGQTVSQGKLTLGNLEQINNALPGFSSVAALAAVRGQTTAVTMQQISSGAIDAKTGINQLLIGMKEFPGAAGSMQKQSQTLLGVFSTFQDTVSQALSGAFAPAIPAIKDTLTQVTPVIGTALQTLAPALGGVVTDLLKLLGPLTTGLSATLAPLLSGLGDGIAALAPAFAPLGAALGSIGTAIEPVLPLLGQLIATLFEGLAPIITSVAPLISGVFSVLTSIITPLLPVIVTLGNSLGSVLLPIFTELGSALQTLAPQLATIFMQFAQQLIPVIQLLAPDLLKLLQAVEPLIPTILALLPPVLNLVVALTPLLLVAAQLIDLLTPLVAFLLEAVAAALQFLTIKALIPILEAVVGVVGLLGESLEAVIGWLDGVNWHHVGHDIVVVLENIGDALKIFWQLLIAGFEFIGQEIWDFLRFLGKEIADFFVWIGTSIAGLASGMWDKFTTALEDLNKYIQLKFGEFVTAVENLKDQFLAAVENLWTSATTRFTNGVDAIVNYIGSLPSRAMAKFDELKTRVLDWASGALTWLEDAGKNLITGLIHGVEEAIPAAIDKIKHAADQLVDAAKNQLGVHSPSTVFAEIGRQTVAGFTQGVDQHAGSAAASVSAMLDTATQGATTTTNTSASATVTFSSGAIVVNVSGSMSSSQAYAAGTAVGQGISDVLANASARNAVRTM